MKPLVHRAWRGFSGLVFGWCGISATPKTGMGVSVSEDWTSNQTVVGDP